MSKAVNSDNAGDLVARGCIRPNCDSCAIWRQRSHAAVPYVFVLGLSLDIVSNLCPCVGTAVEAEDSDDPCAVAGVGVNVTVKTLADARRKALAFDNRKEHVGNASTVVKPAAPTAVEEPPAKKSSDTDVAAQPVGNPAVEFAANDNGTAGVIGDAAALDLTALELVTDGKAEGSPTSEVGSTKPTSTAVATGRPKHMASPVLGRPHQSPIDPTVAKHFYEMFQ